MKIERVTAEIFGKSRTVAPECPVVVITGANEAGKSTTIRLPELAISDGRAGFPIVGRSGSRFNVRLQFDDGTTIERGVDRKGKHTLEVNVQPGTIAAGQAEIAKEIGTAHSFSLQELHQMTPPKRLRWMEDRILETVDRDLAPDLRRYKDKLAKLGISVEGLKITQAGLVGILEAIQAKDKEANSEALRLGKVVKNDKIESRADELPDGTVSSWRDRIAILDREAGEIVQEMGKIEGAQHARQDIQQQIDHLESVIDVARLIDVAAVEAEHDTKIQGWIDGHAAEAAKLEELREALEKATGESTKAAKQARDAETAEAVIRASVETLQDPPDYLCEACQAAMVGEKDAAIERLAAAEAAAAGFVVKSDAANRQQGKADAAVRTQRITNSAAERAIDSARSRKAEAVKEAKAIIEQADGAAERLEALQTRLMEIPDAAATAGMVDQLEGIKAERIAAQKKADALTDAAAILATREQRRIDLRKAQDTRDDARELLADLGANGLLGRVLAEAVGPFVDRVNSILEPVTGSQVWIETEGGFTWGYRRNNDAERHVPIETASESHEMAAMVAFEIAAKTYLSGWKAVFVDGAEVMQADRRSLFVEQLITACDIGLLDNAWIASVDDGWSPPEGCHFIRI